jgi:tetratricopeptide (TPR) repeat protein
MSIICPSCKKENWENKCKRCGLEMPSVDLIDKESARKWYKDIVVPHRIKWLKSNQDSAIEYYSEAIQRDTNSEMSYSNRGYLYFKKGENDRAIEDYTNVIRINPKNAAAYRNRGYLYIKKGDNDQAIVDYDQSLQLNSGNAAAYNNRGVAYQLKGDFNQAIVDYETAIRINPDFSKAKQNLEKTRRALLTPSITEETPQIIDRDTNWEIESKDEDNYFDDWHDNFSSAYRAFQHESFRLETNLLRRDFIFTIGYNGQKAVIDTSSKRKLGHLSTSELAKRGFFRAAVASAIYSNNRRELEEVADIYNIIIDGKKYEPDDLLKLFGVPRIIKDKKSGIGGIYI